MRKDPEERKKYFQQYYLRNKEKINQRDKERRARLRKIAQDAKRVPCADCGVQYPPYVMDFDHTDPSTKINDVSFFASNGQEQLLIEELDKCEVVCANCHRERTFGSKV